MVRYWRNFKFLFLNKLQSIRNNIVSKVHNNIVKNCERLYYES